MVWCRDLTLSASMIRSHAGRRWTLQLQSLRSRKSNMNISAKILQVKVKTTYDLKSMQFIDMSTASSVNILEEKDIRTSARRI